MKMAKMVKKEMMVNVVEEDYMEELIRELIMMLII